MERDPHGLLGDSVPLSDVPELPNLNRDLFARPPAKDPFQYALKAKMVGQTDSSVPVAEPQMVIYSHTAARESSAVHLYLTKDGREVHGTGVGNPDHYFFDDKQVMGEFDRMVKWGGRDRFELYKPRG